MSQPKYYIEAYDSYYAGGGMGDFSEPYDTLQEAQQKADLSRDWVYIVKVEDNLLKRVASWERTHWDYDEPA